MFRLILVLLFLAVFIFPIFLFVKLAKKNAVKQKESSWKGKLVDKKHLEYEDDDSSYTRDVYSLFFETSEGNKIKINVPKEKFQTWKVGDKAVKIAGKPHPEKAS